MKDRNISIDIYRILCMFLITTIHIISYSGLITFIPQTHLNFYIVNIIQTFQSFSISGFTMISAYFLIDRVSTTKKLINFILQLWFFSILIFFISLIFISRDIKITTVLYSFFPLIFNHYWYPVNYVILLILAPFLNKAFKALTKNEMLVLLIILSSVVSLFFNIDPFFSPADFIGHQTHSLLYFILLYLIAAYIKIYGVKRPKIFGLGVFSVTALMLFIVYIVTNNGFGRLIERHLIINTVLEHVNILEYNSILPLLLTVSSFIMFTNINITYKKRISKPLLFCIPATFVIYLFQEHCAVRPYIWNFVNITKWAESYMLVPVIILIFIAIWCISIILNLMYQFFSKIIIVRMENLILNLIEKLKLYFKGKMKVE